MKPRVSALVAMARNRVIGSNNALPWHLPPDLKRFKLLTMGHPIIMGRKTYESIGRPLPGRISIIITRQADYEVPGAIVVDSLAQALHAGGGKAQEHANAGSMAEGEAFVIGGAEIFRQALPLCDRIYITEIQADFEGDVLFPEFNMEEWIETSRERCRWDGEGDGGGLDYHFVVLDRKSDKKNGSPSEPPLSRPSKLSLTPPLP
ncbi:dihydrofolate reductase [Nitrosospira sp. Nsp2]|uniref:dihydrofolate reductase n=1 Tax=Nitrosospira sp. Nsp2 TaxID=136548 RepID=UPI000D314DA1|nr:dihydrofolate reductase [Nitrosospira sp. Nsp2]PTR17157.1 dihydrofolate reductase [Nitrosospira sp. Nsp2]